MSTSSYTIGSDELNSSNSSLDSYSSSTVAATYASNSENSSTPRGLDVDSSISTTTEQSSFSGTFGSESDNRESVSTFSESDMEMMDMESCAS